MTNRDPDQDILDEYERRIAAGTDLEGLKPVKATISPNARATFSIRLSRDEINEILDAAKLRGVRMSDFIREASMAAAREAKTAVALDDYSIEAFQAEYELLGRKLERALHNRNAGVAGGRRA